MAGTAGPFPNLNLGQFRGRSRLIAAVAVVCVAASLAAVFAFSRQPTYEVLYSDLAATDAASVIGKLKELGVPYKLTEDGQAIEVPQTSVAELRVSLAADGFPQGGSVGYEIFDKSNFGQTDFTQRMNYLRALQGELERMIRALAPVQNARVILQIPQDSIYADEAPKPPTASVVVKLKLGAVFTLAEVRGIKHLLANSVAGMSPSDVAITDVTGKILADSDPTTGQTDTASGELLTAQTAQEKKIQQSIETMLDNVLGPGKAVVRVAVEMDASSSETNSDTYDPLPGSSAGVVRNRSDIRQGVTGAATGGDVGLTANAAVSGTTTATDATTSTPANGRTETVTNYEVSHTQQKVVKGPGAVKRVTVSVLVDGVAPSMLASIKQAVSSAAGIDVTRGDVIAVDSVQFSTQPVVATGTGSAGTTRPAPTSLIPAGMQLYVGAGAGALALLILMLLIGGGRRKGSKSKSRGATEDTVLARGQSAASLEDLMGAALPHAAKGTVNAAEAAISEAEARPQSERSTRFDEVEDRIRRDPYAAALIIRGWMAEED